MLSNYGDKNGLKGTNYITRCKNFSNKAWFANSHLTRRDITYINRMRSGHVQINAHLFRMKIVPSPFCECGNLPQNLEHLIWFCPHRTIGRDSLLAFLCEKNIPLYCDITELATNFKTEIIVAILKFLYANAIFI